MEVSPKKNWKERKKLWLNSLKEIAKEYDFKFKSNYIYKVIDDIVYDSTFNVSRIENAVSGVLSFKPIVLDDIFWDITDMPDNKRRRITFRLDAAFKVVSEKHYRYKIEINDLANPTGNLEELVKEVSREIESNSIIDLESYISFHENNIPSFDHGSFDYSQVNFIGLICSYIKIGDISKAEVTTQYCIETEVKSLYNFGNGVDFFDLASIYLNKFQS
ncbi:MAG: hypothetical protein RLN81_13200 [Balneolaceae bacterium]